MTDPPKLLRVIGVPIGTEKKKKNLQGEKCIKAEIFFGLMST